jgi:hypothetical protein
MYLKTTNKITIERFSMLQYLKEEERSEKRTKLCFLLTSFSHSPFAWTEALPASFGAIHHNLYYFLELGCQYYTPPYPSCFAIEDVILLLR